MKHALTTLAAASTLAFAVLSSSCNKATGPWTDPAIPSDATDLSAAGTANCYIVQPGSVSVLDASVKGNSAEPVGEVASAELVWQSAKGLVKQLEYSSIEKGIVVQTSSIDGNALVAATDAEGNILWSWHLWITDYRPSDSDFTTEPNAAGTTWTFMDRNLGALNTTHGDPDSYGMLYQWGRKDPFPATVSYTIQNDDYSYVQDGEPVYYDMDGNELPKFRELAQGEGTVEKSILNPEVFYTGLAYATKDWSDESDDDRWGGESMTKSVYDPCPPGYKVPVCDAAGNTPYDYLTYDKIVWDAEGHGADYDGIWFPATGTRVYASGGLDYNEGFEYSGLWIGTKGEASKDPAHPDLYGQYKFIIDGRFFNLVSKDSRSQGMSLRCVRE